MNANEWAIHVGGPVAVGLGVLVCFFGYRLVKLTLGLLGFLAGASGGWALGMALAPNHSLVVLGCALVSGVLGAVLCLWLFFLGIFLLGAAGGGVIAVAVLNAAGHPVQPLLVLGAALVFGVLALLLQKLMIVVSTAFGGSYLIIAGLVHWLSGMKHVSPLWFEPASGRWAGNMGYVLLGFWLLVGLAGASFQYRRGGKKQKVAEGQPTA